MKTRQSIKVRLAVLSILIGGASYTGALPTTESVAEAASCGTPSIIPCFCNWGMNNQGMSCTSSWGLNLAVVPSCSVSIGYEPLECYRPNPGGSDVGGAHGSGGGSDGAGGSTGTGGGGSQPKCYCDGFEHVCGTFFCSSRGY